MYAPAGSRLGKLGQAKVERMLDKHYGHRRLHISARHDLEERVETILRRDLGDFCWSVDFAGSFLRRLFATGFLPICSKMPVAGDPPEELYVLLPKLHRKRCVLLDFGTIHVDRGARKRSRRYRLAVDSDFQGVVQGCIEQHGESWLWPPMRDAFLSLLQEQQASTCEAVRPEALPKGAQWESAGSGQATQGGEPVQPEPVAEDHGRPALAATIHSVELWAEEGGDSQPVRLVAGEIGYVCGTMYTSLTGFYRESGAGTVQLLAVAGLLLRAGVQCWDLGMNHDYKDNLGAQDLERADFVTLQRSLRGALPVRLALPGPGDPPASTSAAATASSTAAAVAASAVATEAASAAVAPAAAAPSEALRGSPVAYSCCSAAELIGSIVRAKAASKMEGVVHEAAMAPHSRFQE